MHLIVVTLVSRIRISCSMFCVRWREVIQVKYMNKIIIKSFLFVESVGFDCISALKLGFVLHSGSPGVTGWL